MSIKQNIKIIFTHSFFVALGSVLHETIRQAAPGKWISVVVLASVTGYSSKGNISGAVYKQTKIHVVSEALPSLSDSFAGNNLNRLLQEK